jgi:DNA repair exonuclease SbcCD ATPase subunit
MKILQLTASNLMRLKAIDITPEGNTVVISGRNAQGKTSVLNAIWFALGGAPAQKTTKKPVRDGEKAASVRLDLGDIVVTRSWTSSGDSTLRVESADGARYGSPQAMLDKLVGSLSFDPLAWSTKPDKEQLADLLKLIDLPFDLDDMASQRSDIYDARTEVNRNVRRCQQEAMRLSTAVETERVDVQELFTDLRKAEEHNRAQSAVAGDRERLYSLIITKTSEVEKLQAEIVQIRAAVEKMDDIQPDVDTAPILETIGSASDTNRAAEQWELKQANVRYLEECEAEAKQLTEQMARLDATKEKAVAAAKMPVDGLGFDESGVTYEGVPFRQCSSAERLRVSLAMAMSLNPDVRVIRILDGSLLDSENMAVIREMADDNDYQLWVERVEDDTANFVIEDGAVL